MKESLKRCLHAELQIAIALCCRFLPHTPSYWGNHTSRHRFPPQTPAFLWEPCRLGERKPWLSPIFAFVLPVFFFPYSPSLLHFLKERCSKALSLLLFSCLYSLLGAAIQFQGFKSHLRFITPVPSTAWSSPFEWMANRHLKLNKSKNPLLISSPQTFPLIFPVTLAQTLGFALTSSFSHTLH